MIRKTIGKIFYPIKAIPLNAMKIARDKNINLNQMFEVVIQSARNPDLKFTKIFKNYAHLNNFIENEENNGQQGENSTGLNKFRNGGVMDNVSMSISGIFGGCSKHDAKKHDKVYENHIYIFNVVSQVSLHKNCGIECLRSLIGLQGTPEDIRRKYDIVRKTKMTFEQLNHIYVSEIE